jgi:hypothetical protein
VPRVILAKMVTLVPNVNPALTASTVIVMTDLLAQELVFVRLGTRTISARAVLMGSLNT